jgi:hypothetical protein
MSKNLTIAIDADGTCFTHEYPNIGKDIGAVPVLKRLVSEGHRLMLWTMRSHVKTREGVDTLDEAINWFKENNIDLWAINENPEQKSWTNSNKQYANLFIDDAALGCPLLQEYKWVPVAQGLETTTYGENSKQVPVGRPFVNWVKIEEGLEKQGILTPKTKENGKQTTDNV